MKSPDRLLANSLSNGGFVSPTLRSPYMRGKIAFYAPHNAKFLKLMVTSKVNASTNQLKILVLMSSG
jgi:hypothetical protein